MAYEYIQRDGHPLRLRIRAKASYMAREPQTAADQAALEAAQSKRARRALKRKIVTLKAVR